MTDLPSSGAQVSARQIPKRVHILNLLVIALVGGWLGYGVFDRWHWENVQQNWASTDGTIETAYVSRAMSRHVNWETGWTYSYSVDGRRYEAGSTALRNAYLVHMFPSEQQAEYYERTRPVGSIVSVYYDPAVPQHSVLDLPQDTWLDIVPLSLAAACIGGVIWGAFLLAKAYKNDHAND